MNVRNKLRSALLNIVFGARTRRLKRGFREVRRRLLRRPHVVSVFLQIDDPYSYLLSRYLPALTAHYDIQMRLYLSEARAGDYQPAPGMLAEYAIRDCTRVAHELAVPFLDKGHLPPTEHRLSLTATVAAVAGLESFDDELLQALAVFWRGDCEAAAKWSGVREASANADTVIAASQALQQRLGHYNSAMLHHEGEWYWGVDRLHFLLDRLTELGAAKSNSAHPALAALRQAMQVALPVRPPTAAKKLPPLEFFCSFRSPYSYLSLQRVFEIADAYGLELDVRPVLPMLMRGMKVPRSKLLYILMDTSRIATRLGIPFGKIADPIGTGVERSLAVFHYAQSEKRGREFMLCAGVAIWAEAVDVATDAGMRKVTGRAGLFWPDVKAALNKQEWRASIEANRESMTNSGNWGVPSMRLGDFVVWGQDRDWLLVRHIEELCDTGDGILV